MSADKNTEGDYHIVARPHSHDTYVETETFKTVDEAVRYAMSMMWGDDFLIVQIIDWKAEQL